MTTPEFIPLPNYQRYQESDMIGRSAQFLREVQNRRTIRDFSDRPVPENVIRNCISAAGTAPSGANMQPWTFVAISNGETKSRIRIAAEEEEREFYANRAPKEWLEALAPLGTDPNKSFISTAPYLIAIFVQNYGVLPNDQQVKHYYATESVGIATGILLTAIHNAGLVSLTHTPSPMGFLNEILDRPNNERPFLLLVVGYPADDATVPSISKKKLEEIATFI